MIKSTIGPDFWTGPDLRTHRYSVHNYDLLSANESGTCKLMREENERKRLLELINIIIRTYYDIATFTEVA